MRQIHHMWQIGKGFVVTCFHSSKVAGHKGFAEKRVFRMPPRRDVRQLAKDLLENVYSENSTHGDDEASNAGLSPGHSTGRSWSESENRSKFESEAT